MSKYTTEVRFICESLCGLDESQGSGNVNGVISKARSKIFDFDYPIFDEEYRSVLETKILRHYYTREICCETVGLWKLWLCTRLNEIMPYYNQLYESEKIKFDPLRDTDFTVTGKTERDGQDNGKTKGESWNLYSDTPQGGISGLDENTYLTNANKYTSDNTNNNTYESTEDYLRHEYGKRGMSYTFSEMLQKYRETFLNIDTMIIKDLGDLFFNLW